MKKQIRPGFELIFSISLIAIMALPPLVLAQTQKNIEIKISNGDTTVNGKDIKKLTAQERKDAITEMSGLGPIVVENSKQVNSSVVIKRRNSGDNNNKSIVIERSMTGNSDAPAAAEFNVDDSARRNVKVRLRKLNDTNNVEAFSYRFDNDLPPMATNILRPNGSNTTPFIAHTRNTQNFNYSNTDNDGISTNVRFRVNDATDEISKTKGKLNLADLNLVPEFSTGNTVISFNLPAKTAASIEFTDTNGKLLWADKTATGGFRKKIDLPLNGVYYLQVKQGANLAIKKIVKE